MTSCLNNSVASKEALAGGDPWRIARSIPSLLKLDNLSVANILRSISGQFRAKSGKFGINHFAANVGVTLINTLSGSGFNAAVA